MLLFPEQTPKTTFQENVFLDCILKIIEVLSHFCFYKHQKYHMRLGIYASRLRHLLGVQSDDAFKNVVLLEYAYQLVICAWNQESVLLIDMHIIKKRVHGVADIVLAFHGANKLNLF